MEEACAGSNLTYLSRVPPSWQWSTCGMTEFWQWQWEQYRDLEVPPEFGMAGAKAGAFLCCF